ncbi:MAG: flagellar export chaperone FliS [Janthinobacterium lividum]
MFSPSQFGANAYARVGAQTATFGASPQRLAIMMFEATRTAIVQCRMHMRAGRMAEKGAAVSKAVMIIGGGLKESLDMDNGGALATRLAGHYDAMLEMLTRANLRNDEPLFDEVDQMLKALEDAWRNAPVAPGPGAAAMTAQAVGA